MPREKHIFEVVIGCAFSMGKIVTYMKSWGRSDPVSMLLGRQGSLACREDAAQCRSSYKTMNIACVSAWGVTNAICELAVSAFWLLVYAMQSFLLVNLPERVATACHEYFLDETQANRATHEQ